jgi:VIT1/CCC1 family predicted Fe2+/Mn2+ transporter
MTDNTYTPKIHKIHRIGWLRAAVLGANDGLISTASLIVGVAASSADIHTILIAGIAGLVAGAMSMAAGEYVSVSSQADLEKADLAVEQQELIDQPDFELKELANIYMGRGVSEKTAMDVAKQLTAHDALGAHAREELGIMEITMARPLQAAITSAITFAAGALPPILTVLLCPPTLLIKGVVLSTIISLAVLGALGAMAGGANAVKGMIRVMFWGSLAMAATALTGYIFDVSV